MYHIMKMTSCSSSQMIKHENMTLLSELYSSECTGIEQLSVCREEIRQLYDILNIMTRIMSKSKKADVPTIYPLKGEHRKPEHAKPQEVKKQTVVEQVEQEHDKTLVEPADSDETGLPIQNEVPLQVIPNRKCMINQFYKKDQKYIHQE